MPPEKRTIRTITKELIAHPFFPLLFLAEFIKEFTELLVTSGLQYDTIVAAHAALAVVTTVLWVFSDVIEIDASVSEDIIGEN